MSDRVINDLFIDNQPAKLYAPNIIAGLEDTDAVTQLQNGIDAETTRAEGEEARIEALFTAPTQEAVDTWLSEHPEATTTVQDGAITLAKLHPDVRADVEEIDGLKENLNNTVDVSDYTWVLGAIDANGGISSANTRVVNSELIPVTEGTKVSCSGNTNCLNVYKYDVNGSYLGYIGDWGNEFTIPSGTAFIRCAIRKTSWNSTISSDEIAEQSERCSITIKLSRNGVMLGFSTADLAPAVKSVGVDILSSITWERGTLDGNGADYESTSRIRTVGYIDVTGIDIVLFSVDNGYKYTVVTYDSEKSKITSTGFIEKSNIYVIPASASYIRIIMSANPDAWLPDASISVHLKGYNKSEYEGLASAENGNDISLDWFNATAVNKIEIPTLSAGTTILALGDSITAAQDNTGWIYHFVDMTGCTVTNKAVGGTTFGESATEDSGHWMSTQISNVTSAQWESADLVIVACGTNDYGHGTPLDELKTKVQSAITAIKAETDVPIVFITPIRRGTSPTSEPMQLLPVIAGIISNVALKNGCNVIKGFDFPIPTYDTGYVDNFTQDGLHPNAYGANAYARSVINALR